MNKQQFERLAEIGRKQTDAITQSPKAAKEFMIRAGIYTKAGHLKASYGGVGTRKHGGK
jgi:hypothetical protein